VRRSLREIAIFAFFLAAAIALTWPLATHIDTAIADTGDPVLNTWILDWVSYALTHSPTHLFDAPIYYPAKYPLAYSENMIGIAIPGIPLRLAGLPPLTIYNLLMLLGFAHAGYGAHVLARTITRSNVAAFVAGIFFAFTSYKFDHLSHIQIIWSGWLPLILATLFAYWRRPRLLTAALFGGAFLMNGLTNIHFFLFASAAVAVSIIFLAIVAPSWRTTTGAGLSLIVALLLLLPILLPYRTISRQYGARRIAPEVAAGSANWEDWLHTTGRSILYSRFVDMERARAERVFFPGLLPIGLAIYAFLTAPRRGRTAGSGPPPPRWLHVIDAAIVLFGIAAWIGAVTRDFVVKFDGLRVLSIDNSGIPTMIAIALIVVRLSVRLPDAFGGFEGRTLRDAVRDSRFPPEMWVAAIWIVIGIVGSFGMNAFFHKFLFRHVEAYRAIRAAARWAILVYAGLSAWMAAGASELIARRRAWRREATAALLLLATLVDVAPRIRWEQFISDTPPLYRWIARERIGPILELPMHNPQYIEFMYVFYSTAHHVPLMNGTSGWEPPMHERLRWRIESGRVDETFTRALEHYGCKLVVVHVDRLWADRAAIVKWLAIETRARRLAFLRRFDSGMSGDYVLAVTRNLRDWPRLVDTMRDGAGFQPGQNFQRMLRGETTFSSSTFGRLEMPRPFEEKSGELHVSGWAMSPAGIDHVTVLVHGGKLRFNAERYQRPDVRALFPWYPNDPLPGFAYVFPKRPDRIPSETDVQIEIVDRGGRTMRLLDAPITWK
jgi:hypothetical protein